MMFCTIFDEDGLDPGLFLRFKRYFGFEMPVYETQVRDIKVISLGIGRMKSESKNAFSRRMERYTVQLHKMGIKHILIPKNFRYSDFFTDAGFRIFQPSSFMRDSILKAIMNIINLKFKTDTLFIIDDRLEMLNEEFILSIAGSFHTIAISTNNAMGGKRICERLIENYGIPAVLCSGEDFAALASIVVAFSPFSNDYISLFEKTPWIFSRFRAPDCSANVIDDFLYDIDDIPAAPQGIRSCEWVGALSELEGILQKNVPPIKSFFCDGKLLHF